MNIEYKLFFSSRRSISIIINPHKGVIVRAPYRTSIKTIEKFLNEKSEWINKHLDKHKELTSLNTGTELSDGSLLPVLGKVKRLRLIKTDKRSVAESEEEITIGMSDTEDKALVSQLVRLWYKLKAESYLKNRFSEIVSRHSQFGFRPTGLKIRSLKSRWGSCSSKGKITLNSDLIKLNERYIDYVICHELCHLIHHNHSQRYYNLLQVIVPAYKELRKELRKYSIR